MDRRVVYGVDPLCGWCFGFAPVLAEGRERLSGEVEFALACGGLVTGERRRPLAADAAYLRAGLERVRAATGVRSGPAFEALLDRGTYVSDSEPVCRALWVAREQAGDGAAIDMASALSRAFYVDGLEPDDPAVLHGVAVECGLDGDALVHRWRSHDARWETAAWFARSRSAGLETYPSLLVPVGETLRPILTGFAPVEAVVAAIRAAMAQAA